MNKENHIQFRRTARLKFNEVKNKNPNDDEFHSTNRKTPPTIYHGNPFILQKINNE